MSRFLQLQDIPEAAPFRRGVPLVIWGTEVLDATCLTPDEEASLAIWLSHSKLGVQGQDNLPFQFETRHYQHERFQQFVRGEARLVRLTQTGD